MLKDKEEKERTKEWLEAVENWDKYAQKWKDEYFKHKAFLELWSHSFFEKFKGQWNKKDNSDLGKGLAKWYIIGFSIFCLLAIIVVLICLIAK
jgi:hypothetical protein